MTHFVDELVRIASDEVDHFGQYAENSPELVARIRHYAKTLKIPIPANLRHYHWSALFTSFCVKASGADQGEFEFSAKHAKYVHRAIENADAGIGLFRGRDPALYRPKRGDLVCMNQPAGNVTFAQAAATADFSSHTVILVDAAANSFRAARGNNPTGQHDFIDFGLAGDGKLLPLSADQTLICLIEVLK